MPFFFAKLILASLPSTIQAAIISSFNKLKNAKLTIAAIWDCPEEILNEPGEESVFLLH